MALININGEIVSDTSPLWKNDLNKSSELALLYQLALIKRQASWLSLDGIFFIPEKSYLHCCLSSVLVAQDSPENEWRIREVATPYQSQLGWVESLMD